MTLTHDTGSDSNKDQDEGPHYKTDSSPHVGRIAQSNHVDDAERGDCEPKATVDFPPTRNVVRGEPYWVE
jgi:cytochrome c peroxidase